MARVRHIGELRHAVAAQQVVELVLPAPAGAVVGHRHTLLIKCGRATAIPRPQYARGGTVAPTRNKRNSIQAHALVRGMCVERPPCYAAPRNRVAGGSAVKVRIDWCKP